MIDIRSDDAAKGLGVVLAGIYTAWRWVSHSRVAEMHEDLKAKMAHLHECLHNVQTDMDKGFDKAQKRIDRLEERIDDVMMSGLR